MSRSSNAVRTASALAAGVVVLGLYLLLGYLFHLNRRITNEIVGRPWRNPTEIIGGGRADGQVVARVYGSDWRSTTPVLVSELPSHVSNAFIAAEDVRFRRHIGVDPVGIARAFFTNLRSGHIAQGGSTIDQQIIKAKFLSPERTVRRKIIEVLLAVMLDLRMSKDDILEAYLNDVYLGHFQGTPVLGIDEASRLFFDKRPGQLRVDEAALLAGIIRAPNRDTPEKRPDLARARRDAILALMRDRNWISGSDYDAAVRRDVKFTWGRLPEQPFQFYLAALRAEVADEAGGKWLSRGGVKIVSELDPRMQRAAERSARNGVASLNGRYSWLRKQSRSEPLQAAILSVDPRTGGIRALVGGSDFNVSRFDRTTNMRRQPGSAFKTFAYISALSTHRFTNASLLLDAPLTVTVANREWTPHNYDEQFRGRVTLREAFEKSLNVPTVRMSQEVGVGRVVRTASRFGFSEKFEEVPAFPLGVNAVSVRELTAAYTVFPNLGRRVDPYLLRAVIAPRGQVIFKREMKSQQVLDAATAYVAHSLLRGVVQRGTARRLRRYGLDNAAGKTGTTSDYRDAWFVGYTPDLVTTVWVGYDRGMPLRLSSGEAAIPIWGSYMSAIPTSGKDIDPPAGVTFRNIDPESGFLWSEGCPGPIREVFLSGTAPTRHCPTGVFGRIVRRVLFDDENFDEPPAITFEQFRRWSAEVDKQRQEIESNLEKLKRVFGHD